MACLLVDDTRLEDTALGTRSMLDMRDRMAGAASGVDDAAARVGERLT